MAAAARQWDLYRGNFDGCWQGRSLWYERGTAAALDLSHPSQVIDDTCYDIRFFDDDTGLWEGHGLKYAPGGKARHPIARAVYNQSDHFWQFAGVGGQSSLQILPAAKRFAHEFNFCHGRARTMLVLIWTEVSSDEPTSPASCWQLDAVSEVAFRCQRHQPPEPLRHGVQNSEALLQSLQGWRGEQQVLRPGETGEPSHPADVEPFAASAFACHGLTPGFSDGLICSIPVQLPSGAFRLEVGCLVAANLFERLSVVYGADQKLQRWERSRYRP